MHARRYVCVLLQPKPRLGWQKEPKEKKAKEASWNPLPDVPKKGT